MVFPLIKMPLLFVFSNRRGFIYKKNAISENETSVFNNLDISYMLLKERNIQ